jgi:hypothetical protein
MPGNPHLVFLVPIHTLRLDLAHPIHHDSCIWSSFMLAYPNMKIVGGISFNVKISQQCALSICHYAVPVDTPGKQSTQFSSYQRSPQLFYKRRRVVLVSARMVVLPFMHPPLPYVQYRVRNQPCGVGPLPGPEFQP